jgi:hypothetical protein
MNAYFRPDISRLREIPKAETEKLLGIDEARVQELPPDMLVVDQLLHMIQFARQNGTSSQAAR